MEREPIVSAAPLATVLIYIGVIGVLQFASLAFSARKLQGVTVAVRVSHRMSSPLTRHAQPLAALSVLLLLVGVMLRL